MTKCLRIGNKIRYHKFDLPQPDPIFKIIKLASGERWKTMYKNFNMGVGFEIVVKQEIADEVMEISKRYKVGTKMIGRCEKAKSNKRNTLLIESPWGTFNYT
jgi:phosphoribosylformylglycinamidine cyclo-ligase